jgi:L-asparaginase
MHKVMVITTGGTIEKIYDEHNGEMTNHRSFIGELLRQNLRLPNCEIEVVPLMNKDSMHMDDLDRQQIYNKVHELLPQGCPIIIIHGTDTLEVTMRYIWERVKPQQPIILTGAMSPVGLVSSDAMQNLTESLLAAKLLKPGVYVTFHNQVFVAPHVSKDRLASTFRGTLYEAV